MGRRMIGKISVRAALPSDFRAIFESTDCLYTARGGGGGRNVRYLEWRNLVRRKFGTNS